MAFLKSQGGVEYLMVYGFAVLIIAIVIVSLVSYGVFDRPTSGGNVCASPEGYTCQTPLLGSNGQVTFLFGQDTGRTLYNIEMSCSGAPNPQGLPISGVQSFNAILSTGVANTLSAGDSIAGQGTELVSGSEISISGLPCTDSSGDPVSNVIGTDFSGYIWLNYTVAPNQPPYYTAQVASVTLRVS